MKYNEDKGSTIQVTYLPNVTAIQQVLFYLDGGKLYFEILPVIAWRIDEWGMAEAVTPDDLPTNALEGLLLTDGRVLFPLEGIEPDMEAAKVRAQKTLEEVEKALEEKKPHGGGK